MICYECKNKCACKKAGEDTITIDKLIKILPKKMKAKIKAMHKLGYTVEEIIEKAFNIE